METEKKDQMYALRLPVASTTEEHRLRRLGRPAGFCYSNALGAAAVPMVDQSGKADE